MARTPRTTAPSDAEPVDWSETRSWQQWARKWNWTGARPEFVDRIRQRIGESPEERLAWLASVSHPDARAAIKPGEHAALGDDLRVLAYLALKDHGGYRVSHEPMSAKEVTEYLAEIHGALAGLVADPPKPFHFAAEQVLLPFKDGGFHFRYAGDERAGIIGGVAFLVREVGDKFKACQQCRLPFVASRRQSRYCSSRCIDKKWNDARGTKKKEK